MDFILVVLAFALIALVVYLYVRNFYHAVILVKESNFSVRTILRLGGVVFPLLGVFMGAVK